MPLWTVVTVRAMILRRALAPVFCCPVSVMTVMAHPRRGKALTGIPAKIEHDLKIVDNGDNPVTSTSNARYYQELKDAIKTVLEHPYFDGVTDCPPVGIYAGGDMKGHKHAFNQADFGEAMKNTGLYEGACNFWSGPCLSLFWKGFAVPCDSATLYAHALI